MYEALSVVCKLLRQARPCTVVELTKALDNGIFHSVVIYASQIASAYPDANVTEALQLAATHCRLGNHVYFPSLGTGGPCVPLANKYLLKGAQRPTRLTIAADAIEFDSSNIGDVVMHVQKQLKDSDRVAVLGICYRGNIRVHIESPHLKFARELLERGVSVDVHDPLYSREELRQITGGNPLDFPEGLRSARFIYLGADHDSYQDTEAVLATLHSGQTILDNQGTWAASRSAFQNRDVAYYRVGEPGWLGSSSVIPTDAMPSQPSDNEPAAPIVFETKFFSIRAKPDKVNASAEPWYILERPDSVIVITLSPSGKFLLQKQHRPQVDRSSWEFPGGAIDPAESPRQAAERELLEETGLSATSVESLGWYHPIPGLSTQRTHVFLAHVKDDHLNGPNSSMLEEGISAFRVVDIPTFGTLVRLGEIVDGFTLSAFAFWRSLS